MLIKFTMNYNLFLLHRGSSTSPFLLTPDVPALPTEPRVWPTTGTAFSSFEASPLVSAARFCIETTTFPSLPCSSVEGRSAILTMRVNFSGITALSTGYIFLYTICTRVKLSPATEVSFSTSMDCAASRAATTMVIAAVTCGGVPSSTCSQAALEHISSAHWRTCHVYFSRLIMRPTSCSGRRGPICRRRFSRMICCMVFMVRTGMPVQAASSSSVRGYFSILQARYMQATIMGSLLFDFTRRSCIVRVKMSIALLYKGRGGKKIYQRGVGDTEHGGRKRILNKEEAVEAALPQEACSRTQRVLTDEYGSPEHPLLAVWRGLEGQTRDSKMQWGPLQEGSMYRLGITTPFWLCGVLSRGKPGTVAKCSGGPFKKGVCRPELPPIGCVESQGQAQNAVGVDVLVRKLTTHTKQID
mmetsp:Transcript_13077/g.28687  ORF Transcript_13077/g.28687 Transcript_13077/m.28687 type:complete len:414 (+) Transcript_13077:53-1294(+)